MGLRGGGDGQDVVTEVEFRLSDAEYPFLDASGAEDCEFELAELLPRDGAQYREFFLVSGADPQGVLERTASYEGVEAHFHHERENGMLFEFTIPGGCPAVTLAELGALPRRVRGESGQGYVVAEVPDRLNATRILEQFTAEHPGSELAAKREKDRLQPLRADVAFRDAARRRLTCRQWEVLEAAFEAGYYDWPRECTGEAMAERLDITSSTFSQHIHAAERNLCSLLFGDSP